MSVNIGISREQAMKDSKYSKTYSRSVISSRSLKLLHSWGVYDITWAQLNSPHVALLSREVEGPALRYLGNQPKQYGANSGRWFFLEDERRAIPLMDAPLKQDKGHFLLEKG
jgi:hypothetical protein